MLLCFCVSVVVVYMSPYYVHICLQVSVLVALCPHSVYKHVYEYLVFAYMSPHYILCVYEFLELHVYSYMVNTYLSVWWLHIYLMLCVCISECL